MDGSTHSQWHGGGTRTPVMCRSDASNRGICLWHVWSAVPERATDESLNMLRTPESSGSEHSRGASGTGWHDSPSVSIREQARPR